MPSVDSKERLDVLGDLESTQQEARGKVLAQLGHMLLNGDGKGEEAIALIAGLFGKKVEITHTEVEEKVAVKVYDQADEHTLDPEVQVALLGKLKQRFEANVNRHRGVNWADVQRSLEADPAKLWSLQEMENSGHEPDVYMEDDGAYYFGTCSVETPKAHRNIVYDATAEAWLAERSPQETYNGNAVAIVAAMGIDLMDEPQYRHLQTLGCFDEQTWGWRKTPDTARKFGEALVGGRIAGRVDVRLVVDVSHNPNGGLRGSLKVSKA